MRLPTKIPTLLAIFFLVSMVGGVVVFFEGVSRLPIAATRSIEPRHVQITNITDSSFSVSWMTPDPATGIITISAPNQKTLTAYDERDATGKLGKYTTHHISVRNIPADTAYDIKILSNGKTYLDAGKPYRMTTFSPLSTPPTSLEPAYGNVLTGENKPAEGALVYLTLEGGQTLSGIVKPSGIWLIPLNLVRTQDGKGYIPETDRITENIFVRASDGEASAITDTLNDAPVPEMVIGKTYDFRKQQAKGNTPLAAVAPSASEGTPAILGSQTTGAYRVSLVLPSEGAALTTFRPLVQGTGIPGKTVIITLGITHPLTGTTQVGSDGVWRFTPPKGLPAGKQSVTITTTNENGKAVAITHMFEILKSGSQVLGDATPSATLTPTATPAAILLVTPTATPSSSTLAGQAVPTSGNELPTILLILLGLGLMASGTVVLVK